MTDSAPTYTPKLAFFADDFTGATDALERLELGGVATTLFLEPPTDEQLKAAGSPSAIGVAGRTRSLPTGEMHAELVPIFERFRELRARHVHYKVCSTFDSSPETGSIGHALLLAAGVFGRRPVPVVAGYPSLGRWVAFGNLFATFGTGADGAAYRIDRHPVMARHPATPAYEADLCERLKEQGCRQIALLDFRSLSPPAEAVVDAYLRVASAGEGADAVVIDTLTADHLHTIGVVLESLADSGAPLFSVGSSGVESALTAAWQTGSPWSGPTDTPTGPSLILVGSCSAVTREQARAAESAGVLRLEIDPEAPDAEAVEATVVGRLAAGDSVLVATSLESVSECCSAALLGKAFAKLVEACADSLADGLLVVAGGDTASCTVRELGVKSIRMQSPFVPGAPVCQLTAPGRAADNLRVVLKGGQVGPPNLFVPLAGATASMRL